VIAWLRSFPEEFLLLDPHAWSKFQTFLLFLKDLYGMLGVHGRHPKIIA